MTLLLKAIDLAKRAHAGQKRKYDGADYIVHPVMVAAFVECLSGVTDTQIAASYLHDVLEDCDQQFVDELLTFPPEVVSLVKELTNPSKGSKEPRWKRKEMDRDHLKGVSQWAKKIKLIDRTCNLKDMDNAPQDFLKLYLQESELLLEALKGADEYLEESLAKEIQRRKDGLEQASR